MNAIGYGANLCLAGEPGTLGTYNLSGTGRISATYEYLGCTGTGTFTQTAGTNSTTYLYLGGYMDQSGSPYGAYNLSGSGLLSASYENFGSGEWVNAQGMFQQTGGTNSAGALVLGQYAGSSGAYNLDGGLLIVTSLSQGAGAASFNFDGGTLRAGAVFSTSVPMTFGISGGGATFDTAGYNVTLAAPLFGPGGLTKIGSGKLTLATSNAYSGNTLVSGGTLALGNAWALQNSTLDTSGSGRFSFGTLTGAAFGGLQGSGSLCSATSVSQASPSASAATTPAQHSPAS